MMTLLFILKVENCVTLMISGGCDWSSMLDQPPVVKAVDQSGKHTSWLMRPNQEVNVNVKLKRVFKSLFSGFEKAAVALKVLVTQPEGLPMMWSVSLSLIRVQDSIGASGLHSSLWSRWLRSSKPRRQTEINAETPFKCKLTAESRSAGNSDSSASNWSVSWQEKKNMFVSSSSASGTSLNKLKSEPGSDLWSIFWSLTDQRWSERHNLFLLLGFLNVLDSADDSWSFIAWIEPQTELCSHFVIISTLSQRVLKQRRLTPSRTVLKLLQEGFVSGFRLSIDFSSNQRVFTVWFSEERCDITALWHHSAVTSQRGKQVWKHFGFFIPGSSRGIRGTKTSLVTRLRLLYDNLLKNNKTNFSFLFWYINVLLKLLLLLICEFLLFYIFVLWYHQQRADGGGSRFLFCWLMVLFYCPQ